jgi:GxxExxY protein
MTQSEETALLDADLTRIVIGGFFAVYNRLGRGFLESVYEGALAIVLQEAGLGVRRQYPIDVWFRGRRIGHFRADLLINERLIVEIKRAHQIHPRHKAQVYNALKASRLELGLLVNFGPNPTFKRIILTNDKKEHFLPRGT